MFVEELLHSDPLRLISADPRDSIRATAQRMAQHNIGIVVVMDDDDKVAGVLSERDIIRAFKDTEKAIEETVVDDLMTKSVVTVSPRDSLVDAVLAMNTHGIRHLIVKQAGKPVGVISIRDVLRIFAKQLMDVERDDQNGDLKSELVKALAAV